MRLLTGRMSGRIYFIKVLIKEPKPSILILNFVIDHTGHHLLDFMQNRLKAHTLPMESSRLKSLRRGKVREVARRRSEYQPINQMYL